MNPTTIVSPDLAVDRTVSREPVTRARLRIPKLVWLVALLAAAVHIAPYVQARLATPDGWRFTANLSISPDLMQYRVWMRQAVEEGPIISDRFTTEPNAPYLPVPFYYAVGTIAHVLGVAPEWAYAWAGSVLSFLLTLLIYVSARHFLRKPVAIWTAFAALMLGGGMGGWIVLLRRLPIVYDYMVLSLFFQEPFQVVGSILLEQGRGHYVISTLFDTHFLVQWVVSIGALLTLYMALRTRSWRWTAAAGTAYAFASAVHVYAGITLLSVMAATLFLCWRKGLLERSHLITGAVCTVAVGVIYAGVAWLVAASGLAMPRWRVAPIPPTMLFLGFPLGFLLVAWGLGRFWRTARIEECFLLGWLAGCLGLTLSGPFYPWPDRGLLTLQVPFTLLAASIWFSRRERLEWRAVAVAFFFMASTPIVILSNQMRRTDFDPTETYKFVGPHQQAVLAALGERARPEDILIAPWRDRLWIAPEYRGRQYAGHFFLTVDYDRKQAEVEHFYTDASPDEKATFLSAHGIRFVYANWKANPRSMFSYVARDQDPAPFLAVPGLIPVYESAEGTLFEYVTVSRRGSLRPSASVRPPA